MQRPLLLFLLPCFIDASSRIIGGHLVKITEVPYQLSFRRSSHHICGASILNTTVALTAAHCLQLPGAYSIKAGTSNLNDSGSVIHVRLALVHPDYDRLTNDNDIALLFLESPLTLSDKIHPVSLPGLGYNDRIREGMIGRVSGWGITSSASDEPFSEDLRAADLPVVSWWKCDNIYFNRITERMFCAGLPEGRKDSCSGDSGGPFVVGKELYGVVSSGVDCAQSGHSGIYTDVQVLRGFIREYAGM